MPVPTTVPPSSLVPARVPPCGLENEMVTKSAASSACLPKKSFNECTSTALLHAQCLIKQCVLSNKYLVTDKKCGFIGSCRNLQRLVSMSQSQFLATWWNVFQVLQTTASNALSALPLGFELGASWIFVCIVSCESETSCA